MNGQTVVPDPFVKLTSVTDTTRAMVFVQEADERLYNVGTWAFGAANTPDQCTLGDLLANFHINCTIFSFTGALRN